MRADELSVQAVCSPDHQSFSKWSSDSLLTDENFSTHEMRAEELSLLTTFSTHESWWVLCSGHETAGGGVPVQVPLLDLQDRVRPGQQFWADPAPLGQMAIFYKSRWQHCTVHTGKFKCIGRVLNCVGCERVAGSRYLPVNDQPNPWWHQADLSKLGHQAVGREDTKWWNTQLWKPKASLNLFNFLTDPV